MRFSKFLNILKNNIIIKIFFYQRSTYGPKFLFFKSQPLFFTVNYLTGIFSDIFMYKNKINSYA